MCDWMNDMAEARGLNWRHPESEVQSSARLQRSDHPGDQALERALTGVASSELYPCASGSRTSLQISLRRMWRSQEHVRTKRHMESQSLNVSGD
jgi:hypothetical protein